MGDDYGDFAIGEWDVVHFMRSAVQEKEMPSPRLHDGELIHDTARHAGETVLGALAYSDPLPWLERFAVAGEVAIVDLDAALGSGSNAAVIRELVRYGSCRVGGGIRDLAAAREWLDAGATRIVVGTAATPEFCGALPRERVMAAVDAGRGSVVVNGWRTRTGRAALDAIRELEVRCRQTGHPVEWSATS